MRKLKFCMVTTFYPPYNFGGDGIFVYRLANALASQGHTVEVIHDLDAFKLLSQTVPATPVVQHSNITLHSLSRKHSSLDLLRCHQMGHPIAKRQQLKAILEQSDLDVIHFHNISLLGGPDLLQYGRATKLCTLHDHWFVCAMHVLWRYDREACTQRTCLRCTLAGRRPPQLWRYTNRVAKAARQVDAFIAPSQFARQSHLANGFPVPIRCLPHFLPDLESNATITTTIHSRPYFLFAGRLEKIKGVQVLLDLFHTYTATDLLIAGAGDYEAELQQQARGLNHVRFLGRIDSAQLQEFYRGAIAVLVPSLCYETFGLVPIEAFAVGTPVIVHDLGALPEVVQGGGGFTYRTTQELLAAMEKLRTQPELRQQLGQQGRDNFLTNYTEDQHLRQYYNLIDELQTKPTMQEVYA